MVAVKKGPSPMLAWKKTHWPVAAISRESMVARLKQGRVKRSEVFMEAVHAAGSIKQGLELFRQGKRFNAVTKKWEMGK